MPSNARAELLDFNTLSFTPEENEKLERVRELNVMDAHEYLRFLVEFAPLHPPTREINTDDDAPFRLEL